jgi:hypothetical protein
MGVGCMNALDEKMSKLTARESAAIYTRKLFRCTNYTVLATAVSCIITLLFLKLSPTGWGWMLLVIDILTVISGIAGFVSSTESGCYTFQVVMTAITAVLQGCLALVLFTQTNLCLNNLRPSTRSGSDDYGGKALVQFHAVLSLFLFCIQWVAMALACIIHHCVFVDFYEDLDGKKGMRWGSAKVQGEPVEADNVDHAVVVVVKEEDESQMAKVGLKNPPGQAQRRVSASQEFENLDL